MLLKIMFLKIKQQFLLFFLFIVFNTASAEVNAERVQLKISDKITANAEFLTGDPGKPTLFILHGFLLTNSFHTTEHLAETLNESGYSVLSPSLTLGINKRKQSLSCEAIHSHSLEGDIKEIDLWLNWLKNKTKDKVILIGHSTGSIQLIYYLASMTPTNVKHLVLLSLPNFGPSPFGNETIEYAKKASNLINAGNQSLHNFGLSYCKKYPSTAENFLSYYHLSKENIAKKIEKVTPKMTLIMGTDDQRVNQQWNEKISQYCDEVIKIKGANHFFDDEYEFDLLSSVENIINKIENND